MSWYAIQGGFFRAYIRQNQYARYRKGLEDKKSQDIFKTEQVQKEFHELKEAIKDNKKASNFTRTSREGIQSRKKLFGSACRNY